MFISKRAFDEAIKNAICETEEKCWRRYDNDMMLRYNEDKLREFDVRLRKVEEACGLIKTETVCPCRETIYPKN